MRSGNQLFKIALGAVLLVLGFSQVSAGEKNVQPVKAVLELFASQGCSTCPQALNVFRTIEEREDTLSISYHVDYWDYLGWKDTLASAKNTKRQKDYADERGDMAVYTPQMIINGVALADASSAKNIEAQLGEIAPLSVAVDMQETEMALNISVSGIWAGGEEPANIYLLCIDGEETVEILGGENAGKTKTYRNVVRSFNAVGMWSGGEKRIQMAKTAVFRADAPNWVVLVQEMRNGKPGRIIGASQLMAKTPSS
ncbi:DUF1223 domain-containing protein [Polycladidibacter hongkongensis]|uniref:DUF1223 domain-containing protein n=1 Tax=Polycladidibacter hongkongensis TaxID=1647556 RepID=UPI00082C12AD|nr:DUF1223 domain-containing protein [Pseudovibrio hongkongensis]